MRTGEWREGIARVWEAARAGAFPPALAPYLKVIEAFNPGGVLRFYPGSPAIAAHFLRRQDRLIACEIEPAAAASLKKSLRRRVNAKAIVIDGWMALGAYVPPKERRGLVLIDPPFEEVADFGRLPGVLSGAYGKWPNGIYMLWYPIKDRAAPDALAKRLQETSIGNMLRCELMFGPPDDADGLAGSGVIIVNPPFTLERDLRKSLPALGTILSARSSVRIDRLARQGLNRPPGADRR